MTTQSIIIYRNPAEAAFWESGIAFPLMTALFVGFIVVFVLGHFYEKLPYRQRARLNRFSTAVIFGVAILIGAVTFNMLMI